VTWVILARPAMIARDQYDAFRHILGNNFRPTQATNGRDIRATTKALSPSF
jgi:carbonic anhydrase